MCLSFSSGKEELVEGCQYLVMSVTIIQWPSALFMRFTRVRFSYKGFEAINILRKGHIRGVEKGNSMKQIACVASLFGGGQHIQSCFLYAKPMYQLPPKKPSESHPSASAFTACQRETIQKDSYGTLKG